MTQHTERGTPETNRTQTPLTDGLSNNLLENAGRHGPGHTEFGLMTDLAESLETRLRTAEAELSRLRSTAGEGLLEVSGKAIARAIFKAVEDQGLKAHRISYKGRSDKGDEIDLCGWVESALADFLTTKIKEAKQ